MKRIIIFTLLAIVSLNSFAQNITNKQFAVIHYDLNITDEFRDDLKPVKKFLKNVEVHNKDADDKLKALMVHHFYYHLTEKMEEKLEVDVIPINSFMQEVDYNEFGYPKTHMNKVLRIGDAPFYFKLKIDLNSKTEEKKDENPDLEGDIIFPEIKIEVTVFNDEGIIPVDKWVSHKITSQPYQVNERFFRTFVKEKDLPEANTKEVEPKSLFDIYSETVDQLIENAL